MTRSKLLGLLALFFLMAFAPLPVRAADETPSQPYVVLVGIDKYADPQIVPRNHAEDDARALYDLGQILGLFWKAPAGETWAPEVLALVEAREAARKSKDWKQADEIRGRLLERGVTVEDGPQGPKLKKK